MTTGEGGMMTSDDDALTARLRLLRSHGMTCLSWDRHKGQAGWYAVGSPGDKSRLVDDADDHYHRTEGHVGNMMGNHREVQLAVCVDAHTMRITPTCT